MATNKHIGYNAFPTTDNRSSMAAAVAGRLLHARNESLNESLSDFEGSVEKDLAELNIKKQTFALTAAHQSQILQSDVLLAK